MQPTDGVDWPTRMFDTLCGNRISLVAHVPDAAHAPLIAMCEAQDGIDVVTLTTEEEGVGLVCGAWTGGRSSVLLMQSSGVGNCINALALPTICRIPLVMIVSMRGEWGEFNPWQEPMGMATPKVLEAINVRVLRVDSAEDVATTTQAALHMAVNARRPVAVVLSQKMIGAKLFAQD